MKKLLLSLFGLFLAVNNTQVVGHTVRVFNHTPYKVDFFAHTGKIGCCSGKEVGGKCQINVEGKKPNTVANTGLYAASGFLCGSACWKYVNARIYLNDGTTVDKVYEVGGPILIYKADEAKLNNPTDPSVISSYANATRGSFSTEEDSPLNSCRDIEVTLYGTGTTEQDFLLTRVQILDKGR